VVGTLLAPIFAQRLFRKNRQLEIEADYRQRAQERQAGVEETALQYRRDVYIRLNGSARDFRSALKNCTYQKTSQAQDELDLARGKFSGSYSEAQLVGDAAVLAAAHLVSSELADIYGRIKAERSAMAATHDDEEQSNIRLQLNGSCRDAIRAMREVMRGDLGILSRPS
jgi:hypothetical protein